MADPSLYLGADVGGTFTKIVLIDHDGRVLSKETISSRGFSRKPVFAARLEEAVGRLCERAGRRRRDLIAVGVGVPGPVDFGRGLVMSLTNIRGWTRFPLARFLRRRLRVPVFVENDANCMALAESRRGAARGYAYALCVTLGTGVGGGLILDNKVYRGPLFLGGEVGHIPVGEKGPSCSCGGAGCLERFVGNAALAARARRTFEKGLTLEEISARARAGDRRARKFWQEAGTLIGRALAGVVHTCGPEVIVIGGGVAAAGRVLLDAAAASLRRHAMNQIKGRVKVRKALLGNDAGMIGAALLAKEQMSL